MYIYVVTDIELNRLGIYDKQNIIRRKYGLQGNQMQNLINGKFKQSKGIKIFAFQPETQKDAGYIKAGFPSTAEDWKTLFDPPENYPFTYNGLEVEVEEKWLHFRATFLNSLSAEERERMEEVHLNLDTFEIPDPGVRKVFSTTEETTLAKLSAIRNILEGALLDIEELAREITLSKKSEGESSTEVPASPKEAVQNLKTIPTSTIEEVKGFDLQDIFNDGEN